MSSPIPYSITRAERAVMVAELRAKGLSHTAIAKELGISRSYASLLAADPTGEIEAARKRRYQGVCADCGGPTWGGGGRSVAPTRCSSCDRKRREAQHGTKSRYNSGCSCDDCRAANRDHSRSLKGKPPPRHGASGYTNYGCRCRVCCEANLVHNRANGYEYQKRYAARKRAERRAA